MREIEQQAAEAWSANANASSGTTRPQAAFDFFSVVVPANPPRDVPQGGPSADADASYTLSERIVQTVGLGGRAGGMQVVMEREIDIVTAPLVSGGASAVTSRRKRARGVRGGQGAGRGEGPESSFQGSAPSEDGETNRSKKRRRNGKGREDADARSTSGS